MTNNNNNLALRNLSALIDYSKLINSSLDLDFALNHLLLTCFGKFHITKGIVLLLNDNKQFEVKAVKGFLGKTFSDFTPIPVEDYQSNTTFIEFVNNHKFAVVKEINTTDGLRGVLLLGKKMLKTDFDDNDHEFIDTLVNIGASAIENSITVTMLKGVNRELDAKVNQLSTLFDLSKEFSGILKSEMVEKLLVFSIIGQMFVSKYGVIVQDDDDIKILDTKYPVNQLKQFIENYKLLDVSTSFSGKELKEDFPEASVLGVELIVPMQIKGQTKGIIILGSRLNKQPYSRSDIDFVYSLASLAMISLENARLFEEALEKQRMEKDLELARTIQKNLLPKALPKLKEFDFAAYNNSAKQVGGDYYDLIKLSKNKILIAIADVSGKGMQAALLVANLQAFIKSICKQNIPLDEATNLLNDLISENTVNGSFITFFWAEIDIEAKTITYVNAGHNPPLLIRNGEIITLKKGGIILGVMETMIPYVKDTVSLKENDALHLFTDGITEAMNINDVDYTDERFEELVKSMPVDDSAEIILNKIIEDVNKFTTGAVQSDDITALVMKVNQNI